MGRFSPPGSFLSLQSSNLPEHVWMDPCMVCGYAAAELLSTAAVLDCIRTESHRSAIAFGVQVSRSNSIRADPGCSGSAILAHKFAQYLDRVLYNSDGLFPST